MTTKEYNTCVDKTADGLYRFCLKLCRQKQEAQDVVQLSYERLWNNHASVNFKKAKTWLFTTARRIVIDKFRRRKTEAKILDLNLSADVEKPENMALKDLLDQALNTLKDQHKQLILLKDYEGYSYKEIADITDLSMSQVKVYLYRARKALRKWINDREKKVYDVYNK